MYYYMLIAAIHCDQCMLISVCKHNHLWNNLKVELEASCLRQPVNITLTFLDNS